jgi:hypothetical protein
VKSWLIWPCPAAPPSPSTSCAARGQDFLGKASGGTANGGRKPPGGSWSDSPSASGAHRAPTGRLTPGRLPSYARSR